jgi:hypothetical protein
MTVKPTRHRLVQLTGTGATVTGAVSALDVVVRIALAGSVPTGPELVLLALSAAFAVLGVGVVRRSPDAARGAGLVAFLLGSAGYVRVASVDPGPAATLSVAPLLVVCVAATVLFTALVEVVRTLTAERNSAPVRQAHVAGVRRTATRQLWLFVLLGVPGTVLFLAMTVFGSPGTASWATSPTLLGVTAVVAYSVLAERARVRRLRHRTLLLEYGVLLDAFGREIPRR